MWAIVSNNCWGGAYYTERALQYNTPTIGLWLDADSYLRFLRHFRAIIGAPLSFDRSRAPSDYPLASLPGGIDIHFMHYGNEDQAAQAWQRRRARLPPNDDDIRVKICDRDGFAQHHLDAFDRLPFGHKIAFVAAGRFDVARFPWAVEIPTAEATLCDGQTLWDVTRARGFDPHAWRMA